MRGMALSVLAMGVVASCMGIVVDRASAVPLLTGIPGATTYGDLTMTPNDDGSSNLLDLPFAIDLFGSTYGSFYINNNGNVTFNTPLGGFTPVPFPVTNQPMIAPYWGDVDTSCITCGNVYVGSPNQDTVVVTWNDVGYYGQHSDRLNNFQLVLMDRSDTGAGNFDIQFRYDRLEWTTGDASGGSGGLGGTPAQAGYDAGNNTNYFALPGSFTENVLNLANTSNVSIGTPGLWIMAIRNGGTSDGSSPEAPLLPEIVTETGWHFDFNVELQERVFIDPLVAIGYDYIVDAGPNITSVLLPAIPEDSDGYDIYLFNSVTGLFDVLAGHALAGVEFMFGIDGVDRFGARDIDIGLDPTDTLAFITGLTFVDAGEVQMRQVPFTVDVPAAVPEPSSLAILLGAAGSWLLLRRRRAR